MLKETSWKLGKLNQEFSGRIKLLENWVQLGRMAENGLLADAFIGRAKCQDLIGQAQCPEVHEEAIPLPTSAWDSHQGLEGEKTKMKYIFITIIIIILSPIFSSSDGVWQGLQSRKTAKVQSNGAPRTNKERTSNQQMLLKTPTQEISAE